VVGGWNSGVEAAIDLAGIVASVTLFEFAPKLKVDKVLVNILLSLPNVRVIKNARTQRILGNDEKVTALEYEDWGNSALRSASLNKPGRRFHSDCLFSNSAFLKGVVELNRYGGKGRGRSFIL
jgi:alkyl hydroperoxide reductase subunit F